MTPNNKTKFKEVAQIRGFGSLPLKIHALSTLIQVFIASIEELIDDNIKTDVMADSSAIDYLGGNYG
jgi:hypothetical protein